MNRRQVVLASLKFGAATRSTLSRAAGISPTTTGKIIEELVSDGILRPAATSAAPQTGPGRPGYYFKINDVQPRFLGVQLGPSQTRLTAIAVAPVLRDSWAKTLPTEASLPAWVDAVSRAAKPLLRQGLSGLLVSVPGVLDEATGKSVLSPNVHWMDGQAVAAALGAAMGIPAHPVQEIQCLALGHRAANAEADDFLLVDFGFGIGSAAMVRGQLFHGPRLFAGEIGHTPVPGNKTVCPCGGVGCLETIAGRRQLFGADHADNDAETLSAEELKQLRKPSSAARVRSALEAAGFTIASAMNALGLDHVVVTGYAADLPAEIFAVLRQSITTAATAPRFGMIQIEKAPRHRLAGLASVGIDRLVVPI
ncbi:MAG: transcriptional repressor of the xylose operon [Phycisphaerales bacterium]|nr:transcriptional repressor of the xylose operon [Phycisphaerales bacterium]